MTTVVWLVEGTWEACVDAVRRLPDGPVALLHVIDDDVADAWAGAPAGLMGRGGASADVGALEAAGRALLEAARERLGREAQVWLRAGRSEHVVVGACGAGDLLVMARDDPRPGPHGFGRAGRFVVDHAGCDVLVVRGG